MFTLITNNPIVEKKYSDRFHTDYFDDAYLDVLKRARDCIHQNYSLLTHPLSGSVKPKETPYKSILLRAGKSLDIDSLMMIENAISSCEKFSYASNRNEKSLDDFALIDLSLFESALPSIYAY